MGSGVFEEASGSDRINTKDMPADVIAKAFILDDEVANLQGKDLPLPFAFHHPGAGSFFFVGGRHDGPDRVGGRSQFVGGDMGHGYGLAGRQGGKFRRADKVPRRGVGMARGRMGLLHGNAAIHPLRGKLDRATRPPIVRAGLLEIVEDMFRAAGSPDRQEMVVLIRQDSATADRDESFVADAG